MKLRKAYIFPLIMCLCFLCVCFMPLLIFAASSSATLTVMGADCTLHLYNKVDLLRLLLEVTSLLSSRGNG